MYKKTIPVLEKVASLKEKHVYVGHTATIKIQYVIKSVLIFNNR